MLTRTDRRRFPILLAAIAALLVFIAVDAVSRPVQAQTPAAELMGLSLDSGTLRPAFDSAVTEYRAAVKHNVSQITVTGTAATGVTVTYQDATGGALADADGDTAGHQVDLRVGETVFQVEAASGSDTETYTVTMERDASAFLGWTPSRDIDLDGENTDAVGMWSNDTTLWVADSEDAKLYAYTLATGTRDSGEDIDLHADNAKPHRHLVGRNDALGGGRHRRQAVRLLAVHEDTGLHQGHHPGHRQRQSVGPVGQHNPHLRGGEREC